MIKRFGFAIFGLLGIAISAVEGVEPFIEVTKWIAWFTNSWTDFWRLVWSTLFGWLGINIPQSISDGLTGCLYITSFVIAARKVKDDAGPAQWLTVVMLRLVEPLIKRSNQSLLSGILDISIIFSLLLAPLIVLTYFVFLHSMPQALALICLIVGFVFIAALHKKRLIEKLANLIFGNADDNSSLSGLTTFALMVISMPLAALSLIGVILLINEIAANGDNITALYEWARCDAGIECKEAEEIDSAALSGPIETAAGE